jgi:hypothetical protein
MTVVLAQRIAKAPRADGVITRRLALLDRAILTTVGGTPEDKGHDPKAPNAAVAR